MWNLVKTQMWDIGSQGRALTGQSSDKEGLWQAFSPRCQTKSPTQSYQQLGKYAGHVLPTCVKGNLLQNSDTQKRNGHWKKNWR